MRITRKEIRTVYLVEFELAEAGELRAIGMLPPRYQPETAKLWLTATEIGAMAELPISSELRSKITTTAAIAEAGWP